MNRALDSALAFLRSAQGTPAPDVHAQFRGLRAEHPDVDLQLLANREEYDVLLRPPEGGTISLGYAADHGVPWLLRSASHSHECDVATVNGRLLDIQTVVAYLDFLWNDTRLLEQMVDDQLVDEAVEQLGIEPTRADIDAAVHEFRVARGLFSADDTRRWMDAHGITRDRLEWIVSRDSAARALRRHVVTEEQVRARMGPEFDTAYVARFRADTCDGDFYAAAQEQFVATGSADRFFVTLVRRDLAPEVAERIFAAKPGTTLTGVPSGAGADVVLVIAFGQPERATVERVLFSEWLEARREKARVEWFWGNASPQS